MNTGNGARPGAVTPPVSPLKAAGCSIVVMVALSAAVISVQLLHEQPEGECTDHLSTWLWVYMGALIMTSLVNFLLVLRAGPNVDAEPSAAQAATSCCHGLLGLFSLAWWITGIVWYTQLEDAGCTKQGMDLMLALIIMPGVGLGIGCCMACMMMGALLAGTRARAGAGENALVQAGAQPYNGGEGGDGVGEWGATGSSPAGGSSPVKEASQV